MGAGAGQGAATYWTRVAQPYRSVEMTASDLSQFALVLRLSLLNLYFIVTRNFLLLEYLGGHRGIGLLVALLDPDTLFRAVVFDP